MTDHFDAYMDWQRERWAKAASVSTAADPWTLSDLEWLASGLEEFPDGSIRPVEIDPRSVV